MTRTDGDRIVLRIAPEFADLNVDVIERRLEAVARALDLSAEIMIAPLPARLQGGRGR